MCTRRVTPNESEDRQKENERGHTHKRRVGIAHVVACAIPRIQRKRLGGWRFRERDSEAGKRHYTVMTFRVQMSASSATDGLQHSPSSVALGHNLLESALTTGLLKACPVPSKDSGLPTFNT